MENIKKIFGGDFRQLGMIVALVGLIVAFQALTGGKMLTSTNMMNLLNGNAYILVLAVGMVLVIIAGHIDLSVGSVAAAVGIIVALAMQNYSLPWWAAILLGLAVGALIGAWQGFWVAYVGIPAFIVTLAGMLIFRGVNQAIGQSNSVPVSDDFGYIGAGYLPEVGPNTGYNNLTLLLGLALCAYVVYNEFKIRRQDAEIGLTPVPMGVTAARLVLLCGVILYVTYLFATGRKGTSVPVSAIILGVLVMIYSFISSKTILGRHIYAVGGNLHAAELSGVRSKRVNFLVMMNMSILAALAGMMFVARSGASGPFDGNGWELDAIAAVFIGGAAVSGGVGTVLGSIVGGFVMAVLNSGLYLMGVGAETQAIIKGLVLLIAVAIDVYNKSQGKTSIIGMLTRGMTKNAPSATARPAETTEAAKPVAVVDPKPSA